MLDAKGVVVYNLTIGKRRNRYFAEVFRSKLFPTAAVTARDC